MPNETPEPSEAGQVPADPDASALAFGTGADGAAPARPPTVVVDDTETGASDARPPIDVPDSTDDSTTAEIDVNTQVDNDADGFLGQVADAVGDLWDDADDGVS